MSELATGVVAAPAALRSGQQAERDGEGSAPEAEARDKAQQQGVIGTPASDFDGLSRVQSFTFLAVIGITQLGWIAALAYAAFRTESSIGGLF
jgi:hypothetical protein